MRKTKQNLLLELALLEQQIVAMSDRKHYLKTVLQIRTRRYPFKTRMHREVGTQEVLMRVKPPNAGPAGSVTITYQQLEKVLQECRWGVESAPGEDPPDGYEALPPDQAEIADACWHRGMEQLSTALLNWCYDQLKAQSPNEKLTDSRRE